MGGLPCPVRAEREPGRLIWGTQWGRRWMKPSKAGESVKWKRRGHSSFSICTVYGYVRGAHGRGLDGVSSKRIDERATRPPAANSFSHPAAMPRVQRNCLRF